MTSFRTRFAKNLSSVVLWEVVLLQSFNASFLLYTFSLHQEAYVLSLKVYLENVAPKVKEEDKDYFFKLLSKTLKVSVTFERPFLL